MKTGIYYGIDFGTTNTAVVQIIVDKDGIKKTNLGEDGEYPFASIVAIAKNGEKMLFSRDVKKRRLELSADYTIVSSIKTFLNNNSEIIAHGKRYSAVDITTKFLSYIREYIKKEHGVEINEVTVALPNNFTSEARNKLVRAAEQAGIIVRGFASESTAAYIANKNQAEAYSKAMVIDWGGGTIDISILDFQHNKLYEQLVFGDRIGGDDIDLLLAEKLHGNLVKKTGLMINFAEMSAKEKDDMVASCEDLKINFSNEEDDATIILEKYGKFASKTIPVTYEYFQDVIAPIIKNTGKVINKTLRQAKTNKAGIDAVILVGGSCNLQPFCNMVSNLFGEEKIIISEKMQWSVAEGVALIGALGNRYYLNDDIGVVLSDDSIHIILEKNTAAVGTVCPPISFALTEDTPDAHFIFTNGDQSVNYGVRNVYAKGFWQEKLELTASIGIDQIAKIIIKNKSMGNDYVVEHHISNLNFYYDLSELD